MAFLVFKHKKETQMGLLQILYVNMTHIKFLTRTLL